MKAYEIRDDFGFENLVQTTRPEPQVGPGQVKVEMRAASTNYRDLMMIQGQYNPNQPLPLIPFSDGAGEVVEVGEGVDSVAVGDRVTPLFNQGWMSGEPSREKYKKTMGGPLDGALAEYVVVDADGVVAFPDHLSFEEAATLPCAGLTAWHALVEAGSVKAGDVVVCQGTGGVSMFGLKFALMHGCEVIVTSSSDEKLDRAAEMGASHGINYREREDWGEAVREVTGGRGADHIIEVGGAGTLQQSLQAATYGGQVSVIGVLSGVSQELNVIPILMHSVCVQGIFVGSREMHEHMVGAIEANQMRPPLDRVFDFDELHEALEYVGAGEHIGKIAIRIGG
ncbi:MAG: zinc-dependent alcohol dehydrogenase family protein [Persicimonas sp.]